MNDKAAFWILRCSGRILVQGGVSPEQSFPYAVAGDVGNPGGALLVGDWQGAPCYAADVDATPAGLAGELTGLREVFGVAGAEAFALAGRASLLLDWQRNHRHCGRCATPTVKRTTEFAMECPACGLLAYPRISPAVMVLVMRGDRLLLARSPHFRPGVFSALAGFVEAGETLEQCAVREVREEVGIEIANLRYFQSQPWPFPDSLMLAFFADYAGGTITPDPSEIEAADWFSLDALPSLPDPVSISRRLIDAGCRRLAGLER
ncbi:NAD(+) diphosphatase [uncultured Propionivibrio sp.]|uniref:NAD(+) diphosphatase n=1 Tax=uncultured Propionivibrio sp. TaxID=426737 RepID=UPI0029C0D88F|nr:NAD(+) diphosphatase [uncultured Propionivibrio sp.]